VEFNIEVWACVLWLISALLILGSVIASYVSPLLISYWNILQTVSFIVMAIALFTFSIGLSQKNKDISQLALVASICSIILFAVLMFSDPTVLFLNQGFVSKTITLIAAFAASLFLVYLSHWVYTQRYSWGIENPALLVVLLNLISAFFLFFEKVSALTFYKLEISYVMIILAMIANIYLFKKIKID